VSADERREARHEYIVGSDSRVGTRIEFKQESQAVIADWLSGDHAEQYVASALIQAIKPV
jgi:hypothetical protein